jgi:1,4-alpha-glucan branching enzyme
MWFSNFEMENSMIKKKYVKSRKVGKVTFELSTDELPEALEIDTVHLVGDFNDWDRTATPMTRRKNLFKATVELEPGRDYQFRYLVNGEQWYNDWHADGYAPNEHGSENCIVVAPSGTTN